MKSRRLPLARSVQVSFESLLQPETTMHRRNWVRASALIAATLAATLAAPLAFSQGKEIKIAHIYSKTGPLEAYGKQTATGFMMGLDYATGGTMMVAGKKLVVIEKDDQGKPDVGLSLIHISEPTRLRRISYAV